MASRSLRIHFTNPMTTAIWMVGLLALFAAVVFLLFSILRTVFEASPYLNGVIVLVFLVGVGACFWQVFQVSASVNWLKSYASPRPNAAFQSPPRLLAPLAVMMKGNQLPKGMSTASTQSILDSVATRMDESRDITRYIINVLIFLGLLGTFYGLATTIPAVLDTIRSLQIDDGDPVDAVSNLMTGLENQLGGMGTAFGSSLIGLSGSLMVGLLELFAGHSQNRFYREFEEWLSSFTTVGMAEKGMEIAVDPSDDTPLARAFRSLSDSLKMLDNRLAHQSQNLGEMQATFMSLKETLQDQQAASTELRNAVRSMETQLIRMNEDMATGRDNSTKELRRDLIAINQTLREIIDGARS